MNPQAVAGALGPQMGSHVQAFQQRAAVCDYKAADLSVVADCLGQLSTDRSAGRLDRTRLAAFGHSVGGNAALEWCKRDARCLAAANLDGAAWTEVGRTGLDRPALHVVAEHREFAMSGEEAVKAGMALDAAWFDAAKAITFGGWRTVHNGAHPELSWGPQQRRQAGPPASAG